jgi:hypothetical protein
MNARSSLKNGQSRRRGYTFLEVQVAFIVLGVALAGLCPLSVVQLKLMARLEARIPAHSTSHLDTAGDWVQDPTSPAAIYYVVPFPEPLAGAFAEATRQAAADRFIAYSTATTLAPATNPTHTVTLQSITYQQVTRTVAAQVQVQ